MGAVLIKEERETMKRSDESENSKLGTVWMKEKRETLMGGWKEKRNRGKKMVKM